MAKQIFLNLPVADLPRSMAFFRALGFSFNAEWTDEHAACMVMGENLFTMLLTRERFQSFTPKPVADAKTCSEVLICLAVDSRAEVDQKVAAALAAGGSVYKDAEDHGFMYAHGFQDLDGHIWELAYMAGQDAA
ncbi:VOC family protein [Chitinimonas taiwanensis]|uniref:Glyoxalase/Bleomycin resistance-like N-terminal domain-containing protein n=1 Tax=Chitinimonas taiwanensis DSM 18899 TaxID=1121279 RepID=A0A1K2HRV7_9NEIS|nr:VOC family protein [Chitinimonas taiwanensis]SFZ79478.1 hypothetical protein SAMN02745887_03660 [Chitinimonas taiwanensis DSM 18899]